jgi:hypothetical protein
MPVKRKVKKSAVKVKSVVKRKVKKSTVKVKSVVKRKVKSVVKRKVKSVVKRKVKKSAVKAKSSNLVIKKGYCEATILDENEPDDPCDIHKSENECISETKDTEYWRSYKCNWKN